MNRVKIIYIRPIVGTKGDRYNLMVELDGKETELVLYKEDLRYLIQEIDNALL